MRPCAATGTVVDRLAYKLSGEESSRVFDSTIAPIRFSELVVQCAPVALFVGGQLGAGKTALQEAIASVSSCDFSTVAIVNGDEFRGYHPRFRELNALDDTLAAFYTDADTGVWVERAIELVSVRRSSLLIEGTLRDSQVTIGTARRLASLGYRNELHMVAANAFYSRLRILSRYLGQRKVDGYGRYTLLTAHDASYAALPESVHEVIDSGLFGRVVLYDIERNVLFDSDFDGTNVQEAVATILAFVRSNTHVPYDTLLADAQTMRRLALELGCNDRVLADVKKLVEDLLAAARAAEGGVAR